MNWIPNDIWNNSPTFNKLKARPKEEKPGLNQQQLQLFSPQSLKEDVFEKLYGVGLDLELKPETPEVLELMAKYDRIGVDFDISKKIAMVIFKGLSNDGFNPGFTSKEIKKKAAILKWDNLVLQKVITILITIFLSAGPKMFNKAKYDKLPVEKDLLKNLIIAIKTAFGLTSQKEKNSKLSPEDITPNRVVSVYPHIAAKLMKQLDVIPIAENVGKVPKHLKFFAGGSLIPKNEVVGIDEWLNWYVEFSKTVTPKNESFVESKARQIGNTIVNTSFTSNDLRTKYFNLA